MRKSRYTVNAAGNVAAWSAGTLTVKDGEATVGSSSAGSFGDIVANQIVTVDGAVIYGSFKATSGIFLGTNGMTVKEDGKVDAKILDSTDKKTQLANFSAVVGGYGDLTAKTETTGEVTVVKLSGAYKSGTISGMLAMGTSLIIGQNASMQIDKDITVTKLVVLGTISGNGAIKYVTESVVYVCGRQGCSNCQSRADPGQGRGI